MAQALYCPSCQQGWPPDLTLGGGRSCPACGEELIRGRVPAGRKASSKRYTPHTSRAVWDRLLKRDPCVYCGVKLIPSQITIDHIDPKALGGSKGSWTNRAGSCRPCNAAKAHTPLLFFMLEQRGVNLAHLKDEDGNWPIPEIVEEKPGDLTPPELEPPKPHELFRLYEQYRRQPDEDVVDFPKAA